MIRSLVPLAVLVFATGCSGGDRSAAPSPSPLQDPSRPYVVTAVDNHFHDAHPSEPIPLDRSLVFNNEGRNLHNVTITGTKLSRDLRPGKRFSIEEIGSLVDGPGRYRVICRYHAELGMTGVLVIVP